MKFKLGCRYWIKWHDASIRTGWADRETALKPKPSYIESMGVYLGDTKDEYVFAGDHDVTSNTYNCVMYRPKGWLLEAREIRFKRK